MKLKLSNYHEDKMISEKMVLLYESIVRFDSLVDADCGYRLF